MTKKLSRGFARIQLNDLIICIQNDGKVELEGDQPEWRREMYQKMVGAYFSRFYVPSWCNAVADWMVENFTQSGQKAIVLEYEHLPDTPGIIY